MGGKYSLAVTCPSSCCCPTSSSSSSSLALGVQLERLLWAAWGVSSLRHKRLSTLSRRFLIPLPPRSSRYNNNNNNNNSNISNMKEKGCWVTWMVTWMVMKTFGDAIGKLVYLPHGLQRDGRSKWTRCVCLVPG